MKNQIQETVGFDAVNDSVKKGMKNWIKTTFEGFLEDKQEPVEDVSWFRASEEAAGDEHVVVMEVQSCRVLHQLIALPLVTQMDVAQNPLIELRDPVTPDVIEARGVALGSLFDRIDKLIDEDGEASKGELVLVFRSQADQFLEFCDFDKGTTLSKEEFVHGITSNTAMLSEVDFQKTWLDRMESCVYAAETGEMGSSQETVQKKDVQVDCCLHLWWTVICIGSRLLCALRHYHLRCAVVAVRKLSTLVEAGQVDPHKLLDEFEDEAALAAAQSAAYPLNMKQEVGVKVTLTTIESVVLLRWIML